MKIIVVYISVVNIIGFLMMGQDKQRAVQGKWRIAEKTIFLTAAAGGAIGVWLGMKKFRHKTLQTSFRYGIPLLMIGNGLVLFLLLYIFI
ncbi:DUF1294 domain-containing protein [Kroppenstedtia pulmonis]|uniref:DUF1294 domain-containing protein n=2 Tax=Kroppenstedtia pulmonis TaxID=1380685 RepID=A0A7D4CXK9_9BACL|nr:DUF1294 domain-containing protein [Kroppenstedtia pulmonis]QKG86017.1 DUF1294 domain-containing protein [Kroppenstedtia pulmonis]